MAVSATTVWRVRIGGNDVNAGCFDPMVVGAGTDYTEQDAAQLTLTDLASAGASTTLSSAIGGFTAAMVGNGVRISGGTGFTAGLYIIAGYTSSNAVTLDRAPSTGAASGATGRVGGAVGGVFGHVGAVPGNVVFIRGQGSNEPTDIDYTVATPSFNTGNGLAYIGYNGRPKISHNGRVWNFLNIQPLLLENLYFVQTAATNTTTGVYSCNQSSQGFAFNCVFDQGGIDATQATNLNVDRCSFTNTGTPVAGSRPVVSVDSDLPRISFLKNSLFKDLRAAAMYLNQGQCAVTGNVIMNCAGSGIVFRPALMPGRKMSSAEIQSTTARGTALKFGQR